MLHSLSLAELFLQGFTRRPYGVRTNSLENAKRPRNPGWYDNLLSRRCRLCIVRPKGFFGMLGGVLVRLRFAVVLFWAVVAPTIAALLGTRPPASAQGIALAEALNV